ncbi:aldehyde dehydrogenase [Pseudemcibacter aquimaris]|uniref:aldehyde dehydrogenase n=1 Tax=Pseudemcibacter aquimaris TaxID=2857064 RepID=UPI0020119C59|nr:aldehyde dehydrogenase [Pseudemcibacter aquimaris]MCC3862105.1 aldehyde dehydrogenase [Pseudemcibacter aquimaris]WDU58858.1 aldehyde dehydrogenase [Pseudemcibacter aquimaris]
MNTYSDWKDKASWLSIRNQAFIDGKFVNSISGKTFSNINPATAEKLINVAECDKADVDYAVAVARKAFDDGRWSNMHPSERGKRLMRLAELIEEHQDELALLETLDMGKPITESTRIDIPGCARCIHWYGEAADKLMDEIAPTDPSALAMVTREALGVIGVVVPWNFPLMMACWKLGPALAAGNSIVLKPAEQSPLSVLKLAELASMAGIPDGVLNVLPGFGETAGKAIGLHMDVDMIAFTGSTQVGKFFMEYSGQSNLKRVSLECGGKSPHIVMNDCPDLDRAAGDAASAIFFNQGEVCTAGSRLLVEEGIKDEFMEKLIKASGSHNVGDPLDPDTTMGSLVEEGHMNKVLSYIDKANEEGASCKLGGTRSAGRDGFFVDPTIFDDVKPSMTIAKEEIFGPVLSVLTFNGEEEAVKIANDTIYGLAAGLWTKDISTAHRMARAVRAGTVWVNGWDPSGDMTIPFGGFKQSGFGRDKSIHALEKYTDLKTTWISL